MTIALEHICDLVVELSPPHEMGAALAGTRRIIPIVGGTARGPRINGRILNVGADWQTVQAGGVAQLDARYAIETGDGAVIEVVSQGIRHASAEVAARIAAGGATLRVLHAQRDPAGQRAPGLCVGGALDLCRGWRQGGEYRAAGGL